MITIMLMCTILGSSMPPSLEGWEAVRVVGKAAASTDVAAVETITLPSPAIAWTGLKDSQGYDVPLPGVTGCKVMLDKTLVCPKPAQQSSAPTPQPAAQVEVTVRRVVRVGDDLQAPKGCVLRVENGEGEK